MGEVEGGNWRSRDHWDRIVYTIGGRWFRMEKRKVVELADFKGRKPDPQVPPEVAKKEL